MYEVITDANNVSAAKGEQTMNARPFGNRI